MSSCVHPDRERFKAELARGLVVEMIAQIAIRSSYGIESRIVDTDREYRGETWKPGESDPGDLELEDGRRLEVSRIRKWTALRFPHREVMVCNCHKWERAQVRPVAFMLFSARAEHFVVIPDFTSPHWREITFAGGGGWDRQRRAYLVETQHVTFVRDWGRRCDSVDRELLRELRSQIEGG